MAKQKQAKFFCEFCDSEVPAKAKFCPKCGHFFLSVRCPVCGKTGSHEEFENGCPQCGYAFNGSPEEFKQSQKNAQKSENKDLNIRNVSKRRSAGRKWISPQYNKKNDDSLPLWIYAATFLVFAGILIFIINQCRT